MSLSTLLEGEYGVSDVAMSTLCVIGNNGVKTTLTPKLSEDEMEKFHASADALKKVLAELKF